MSDNKNKVLSIRIDGELHDNILETIENFHGPEYKISNFVKNFLSMSEFILIKGNKEKFGYDNRPLAIIPRELLNLLFGFIKERNRPLYEIEITIGDWIGRYFSDVFKLRNITDRGKKIEFIRNTGIIEIFKSKDNMVLIPKTFGTEDMVYSFIYRILYDTQIDNEMCSRYLDEKINQYKNFDQEKDKKNKENMRNEFDNWNRKKNELRNTLSNKLFMPKEGESMNASYVFDILTEETPNQT
jgi:hypothetical protein